MKCVSCSDAHPILYAVMDAEGTTCPKTHTYCFSCIQREVLLEVACGPPAGLKPKIKCPSCDRVAKCLVPRFNCNANRDHDQDGDDNQSESMRLLLAEPDANWDADIGGIEEGNNPVNEPNDHEALDETEDGNEEGPNGNENQSEDSTSDEEPYDPISVVCNDCEESVLMWKIYCLADINGYPCSTEHTACLECIKKRQLTHLCHPPNMMMCQLCDRAAYFIVPDLRGPAYAGKYNAESHTAEFVMVQDIFS